MKITQIKKTILSCNIWWPIKQNKIKIINQLSTEKYKQYILKTQINIFINKTNQSSVVVSNYTLTNTKP